MISSSLILAPVAAFAQGMPVIDGTQITLKTKDTVETILLDILGGMVRTALNAILGKLAYDAAVWVASGGENQEAFVHDENNSTYFGSVMDSAGGALVEGFANGVGLDAAALCDPGVDFRLGLTIGLDVQPIMPYEPACSLTELAGNWEQAYKDADFSDMVQLQFDSTANPLGISLEAQNLTLVATSEAKDAAEVDRGSGSFKDKTELVSGAILTPGSQIEKQFQDAEGNTSRTFDTVGKPLTDALNIFASTLVSALMKKVQDGLANTSGPGALTDLVSGKGAGASRGREAAVAKFAELKQPVFAPTGSFDILAQLGACPDNESIRGVTNCAVGSRMLLAITEGWTVQEFVDSLEADGGTLRFAATGLDTASIIGDSGINEHGITLLKTYRVVPVGWQLAAEYIADSTTDEEPTLKDLVDAYDQCGPAEEDYSPFCKLVDPNWVLKAPQNFCVREAAGPTLATDPQTYDSDGSSSTQEKVIYNRLNYCADSRGCIQEEEEDVCTAYGYCTEESRIYRFDGTVCEEEYSSCQSYEDEDGDQISYLKSSLNYNDCATDPGCQWYCNSTNESGDYDCASPTETFITCSEDVANNEADYGLVPSSVDYNLNEACLCELERTCEVAAGSDRGYDPGADGVYDYWQCVITNDDATTQVCSLSNTCGAGSPTYDSGTSTCTCVVEESCDESSGDTTCTTAGGNYCEIDEGGDGAADVCSAELDAYSNAPVCDPAVTLYCGECYVNDGFSSCNTELGNTCTLTSECNSGNADWVGARNQCSCAVEDTCSIPDGAYSCTSTDDNYCVLGSIAEDPTVENDTIYFDDNVKECDSGDAGCNRYVRMLDDTNLIPNAYFDYYDEEQNFLDDENSDFIG
ncbi:MAG: hypothetical protein Q8P90_05395, partial [bacterium]|nr:hypothetical protein [bacterium]